MKRFKHNVKINVIYLDTKKSCNLGEENCTCSKEFIGNAAWSHSYRPCSYTKRRVTICASNFIKICTVSFIEVSKVVVKPSKIDIHICTNKKAGFQKICGAISKEKLIHMFSST